MAEENKNHKEMTKRLDRLTYLMEHILALELNKTNLDRNAIRSHLGVDKAKVNEMLNGIKKD